MVSELESIPITQEVSHQSITLRSSENQGRRLGRRILVLYRVLVTYVLTYVTYTPHERPERLRPQRKVEGPRRAPPPFVFALFSLMAGSISRSVWTTLAAYTAVSRGSRETNDSKQYLVGGFRRVKARGVFYSYIACMY